MVGRSGAAKPKRQKTQAANEHSLSTDLVRKPPSDRASDRRDHQSSGEEAARLDRGERKRLCDFR